MHHYHPPTFFTEYSQQGMTTYIRLVSIYYPIHIHHIIGNRIKTGRPVTAAGSPRGYWLRKIIFVIFTLISSSQNKQDI
jgi:hypothetical protein